MKTLNDFGKDFGAFYPRGHTVVGFSTYQSAWSVRGALRAQGPLFDELVDVTPQEMIDFAEINMQQGGVIANMGTSVTTLQKFLDAARTGAHFLIIPTADDEAAAVVTQVLSRVPHLMAQRYHLLAIEDIP